jgi:parallel beta-helix repeat protein
MRKYIVVLTLLVLYRTLTIESQSCSGISVAPTTNLQTVIDANPINSTFCLQAGTFALTVAATPKNGDIFWGAGIGSTILDGGNTTNRGITGSGTEAGQTDVTVRNIRFTRFTDTGVQQGWRWTVTQNEFDNNLTGVTPNAYGTLSFNLIHHNSQYGLANGGDNLLIDSNDIYANNTGNYCGGSCLGDAGGSKMVGSSAGITGLIWRNNKVHDNLGMGLWNDGNVRATIEGNTVYENTEGGIFHEISWDAVIRNNILTNNAGAVAGQSCFWGAQIHVNNSSNVEIYRNTIISNNGANGICAVSTTRSESSPYSTAVANMSVHNNLVIMNAGAKSGLVWDPLKSAETTGNSFVANIYRVPNTASGTYWSWPTAAADPATWAQWQSAGQDTTGRIFTDLRRPYR